MTITRPVGEAQQVVVAVRGAVPGEYTMTAFADRGRSGVFRPIGPFVVHCRGIGEFGLRFIDPLVGAETGMR